MKFEQSVVYDEGPTSAVFKAHIQKLKEICPEEQIADLLTETIKSWNTAQTLLQRRKSND